MGLGDQLGAEEIGDAGVVVESELVLGRLFVDPCILRGVAAPPSSRYGRRHRRPPRARYQPVGDDLGLTLQTGFVTKALVGLFGSDCFRLVVSANGGTFFDGLSVDKATGIINQSRLPRFEASTNYNNYFGVGT